MKPRIQSFKFLKLKEPVMFPTPSFHFQNEQAESVTNKPSLQVPGWWGAYFLGEGAPCRPSLSESEQQGYSCHEHCTGCLSIRIHRRLCDHWALRTRKALPLVNLCGMRVLGLAANAGEIPVPTTLLDLTVVTESKCWRCCS